MACMMLLFLMLFGAALADSYSELNYGGNDEPLLKGKGSTEIKTKDISATWFSGTTSVIFFVYTDSPDVKGSFTYTDAAGSHTSKWEIKDGGYGYITNGTYVRSGSLNDNYAFISFYPNRLNISKAMDGTVSTGIKLTIDSIESKAGGFAATASLDSVGFYVYAGTDTANGRFLGSLSHLKKINSITLLGDNSSVFDANKTPRFNNYLGNAMAEKMEFSDELRINTANSRDYLSMSRSRAGISQNYTWGAKYKRSFIFTAKSGYRFDPKGFRFIFDGTDYSNYITVSVSNLNKTITVTLSDKTAVYAKKAVTEVRFVGIFLSLTADREPKYTGYVNVDSNRYLEFYQNWKRTSDGRLISGNVESETNYTWIAEFDPGDKFYFDGMPAVKVNGNTLKLYSANGFTASGKVSGNLLSIEIGNITSSKGKATPTPGIDIPDAPKDNDSPWNHIEPDAPVRPEATVIPLNPVITETPLPDDVSPYSGEDNTAMTVCMLLALISAAGMLALSGKGKKE